MEGFPIKPSLFHPKTMANLRSPTLRSCVQTPWRDQCSGWTHTEVNCTTAYNAGFEFIPLVDGFITQLAGFFHGSKQVRLYCPNGNILAAIQLNGENHWCAHQITAVPLKQQRCYTIAVESPPGPMSVCYGIGLGQLPFAAQDIVISRALYGLGPASPQQVLCGQIWGQVDIGFIPSFG